MTHRMTAVTVAALTLTVTPAAAANAAPPPTAIHITAAPAATQAPALTPVQRRQLHRLHLAHLRTLHALHLQTLVNLARARTATSTRSRILRVAASYKGVPYVYGGASPKGVDCSGYVDMVYAEAIHKHLARTVTGLRRQARITNRPAIGDIVFYAGGRHVALVAAVTHGKVTDTWVAPHTGTDVQRQKPYGPLVVGTVL